MRTAIVLAGGRSARFDGQKLAADVEGLSLLATTISRLAGLVDRLIIAGPEPVDLRQVRDTTIPIVVIPDAHPFRGPLAALANVLGSVSPDSDSLAIVVGGDMPALVPDVLRMLFERLELDPTIDALVLGRPDGGARSNAAIQVLPLAVREGPARAAVLDALTAGRSSLRSLLDDLAWAELPSAEWLPLDPQASTLLDVDTRADLERMRVAKGR